MRKIGIIGNGFVGSSVSFGFSPQTGCDGVDIKIYDKDESKATHTMSEVVNDSDVIFVSVPTPSNKDGSISLDIVYDIFDKEYCQELIDYFNNGKPEFKNNDNKPRFHQIEFEELPLLNIRDPAIRRLQDAGVEVNIGDVIQITRQSKTGGDASLYFRRVDYE